MREPLERRLESLREPRMDAETEARIRRRLAAGLSAPTSPYAWRQRIWKGSYAQLALLAVLLAMAGWVVATQAYPVVKSAWERYCMPSKGSNP